MGGGGGPGGRTMKLSKKKTGVLTKGVGVLRSAPKRVLIFSSGTVCFSFCALIGPT